MNPYTRPPGLNEAKLIPDTVDMAIQIYRRRGYRDIPARLDGLLTVLYKAGRIQLIQIYRSYNNILKRGK